MPPTWGTINSVRVPAGVQQRLGVIPAQYRVTSDHAGIQRLFTVMKYTLYYSDTNDAIPPAIWRVDATTVQAGIRTTVEVTDFSDVVRVLAGLAHLSAFNCSRPSRAQEHDR